jgi:hypothetical protein
MRTMLACLVVSLAVFGSSCASSPQASPEAQSLVAARSRFGSQQRVGYSFNW